MTEVVYEEAPFEAQRFYREVQEAGVTVLVTMPVTVVGVGAKGLVLATQNVYGEVVTFPVPIEEIRSVEPVIATA